MPASVAAESLPEPCAGLEMAGRDAALPGAPTEGPAAAKPPGRAKRDSFMEIALVALIALVLALVIKIHVAEAYQIKGQSMQPTFFDGERVMVQKAFYDVDRGDVIIFSSESEPEKDLIKRVIGLPGDKVFVRGNGEVLVNGLALKEDYIAKAQFPRADFGPFYVPPEHLFVLGDNRPQSLDSRTFGCIAVESIKGRVFVRWWPLTHFRSF
jgi:signal peptidase I